MAPIVVRRLRGTGIRARSPVPGQTARERAEAWVAIAWALFRVAYLLNGVAILIAVSPSIVHPRVQVALLIVAAIETVVLTYVLWRRDSRTTLVVVRADVIVICVGLVVNNYALGPTAIASWFNWFFALSLGTVVGAAVWLPRPEAIAAVVAIALAHSLPTWRAWTAAGFTGIVEVVVYAFVGSRLVRQLRMNADEADAARAKAVHLAEELAQERARGVVHDPTSLLSQLAREDLTEAEAGALRAQARLIIPELRRFLDAQPEPEVPLAAGLYRISREEFTDLPLTVTVDGVSRDLPGNVLQAILQAVRTLLMNVRRHAHASQVVLYAETDDSGWEVSVSDNGVGFNPTAESFGYGLQKIVLSGVHAVGGDVAVDSVPGAGTFVSLHSAGRHVPRGHP